MSLATKYQSSPDPDSFKVNTRSYLKPGRWEDAQEWMAERNQLFPKVADSFLEKLGLKLKWRKCDPAVEWAHPGEAESW